MTIEQLHSQILNCRICQDKFGFEPRPYVWGQQNAKIVQISQAPSLRVHYSGKPFDDKSGQRLLEWYDIDEKTFYDKSIFYITSLSHCYPGKTSTGHDRKPPKICTEKWLMKELELLTPEIYIFIGAYSARYFFQQAVRFEDLVFDQNLTFRSKKAIILPHPSPLNWRWLQRFPEFEQIRLPQIRKILKTVILNHKN